MRLLVILLASTFVASAAFAVEPDITYIEGPTQGGGEMSVNCEGEFLCQYGFVDETPSSGFTLNENQQLGIQCAAPFAGSGIVSVGWFSSFWVRAGDIDIVIYNADTGQELSRTTVFVDDFGPNHVYKFDVEKTVVENACVMLCPFPGGGWGVTGEDPTSAPFGNTFWGNACDCANEFTNVNLIISACWNDGATPVEDETWGGIKAVYQ